MNEAALVIIDGVLLDLSCCCNMFFDRQQHTPVSSAILLVHAGPYFVAFQNAFQPSRFLLLRGHVCLCEGDDIR